jgi:hypothetical protein
MNVAEKAICTPDADSSVLMKWARRLPSGDTNGRQPDVWPRHAPAAVVSSLPTPDKRHLTSHNGHELHVRIEWQIGHIKDRTCDVLYIHQRFDGNFAVGLWHSLCHACRQVGESVADVDLSAGNIVLASIE